MASSTNPATINIEAMIASQSVPWNEADKVKVIPRTVLMIPASAIILFFFICLFMVDLFICVLLVFWNISRIRKVFKGEIILGEYALVV